MWERGGKGRRKREEVKGGGKERSFTYHIRPPLTPVLLSPGVTGMTTPTLMLEFADRVGGMSSRLMKRMHVNKRCTEVLLTPVRAVYKSMRTMVLATYCILFCCGLRVLAVVACVSLAVRAPC